MQTLRAAYARIRHRMDGVQPRPDDSGTKRRALRRRAGGDGALVAKLAVAAFAVLMGFAALLIFVYAVIPSAISDAAHLFEHDFAAELYGRTFKNADIPAFIQPSGEPAAAFPRDCFAPVLKENPDIVGRLTISALGLGRLVTQSTDNEYYAAAGYDRKKSEHGAIFLDCRCNAQPHPPKGHYILYGNDLPGMFGGLWHYADEAFFRDNPSIRFDTLYADYVWEVFSAYVAQPGFFFNDTAFANEQDWLGFLTLLQEKSLFATTARLSAGDALLTLCTDNGNDDGERFVVHARLIK